MQYDGEKKRRSWVTSLVQTIKTVQASLAETFRKIFTIVLHERLAYVEYSWQEKATWYVRQHEIVLQARDEINRVLKSRMGHPDYARELKSIREMSDKRDEKVKEIVQQLELRVHEDVQEQSRVFVQRLDYVTRILVSCSDSFLQEGDIKKPPEEEKAPPEPTLQDLLIARQKAKAEAKEQARQEDERPETTAEKSDTEEPPVSAKQREKEGQAAAKEESSLGADFVVPPIDLSGLEFEHGIQAGK